MSSKKPKLSFAELGLSTPLPETLSKSRVQRKQEQVVAKKDKKQRVKAAMENVAASRELIAKHKCFVEKEAAEEKREKAERKRELNIERLRLTNERKEEEKKHAVEKAQAQKEFISQILENDLKREEDQKEIAVLIEQEQMEKIKLAPKSVHINIQRTNEIIQQREGLPVLREEQPIVEAINESARSSVLICGETGSGKTTQIPQFLWEAGYGHAEGSVFGRDGCILVTEPRRVAAVSMARRVAEELNVGFGDEVCYHVRYDNNLSDSCRLKFATEGIVLKEIQSDFLLSKYSVIIVDEAHERSISCDILVGLLSRILPLRNDLFKEELAACGGDFSRVKVKPLKLVIMSATMRVTDFRENRTLFPITPQLINVEARRYPVSNHFDRRTELKEYVDQSFEKVRQIHKKLPPGGILVFLCTQQEIEDLCDRLRKHYAKTKIEYYEGSYSKHGLLQSHRGKEAEEAESQSSCDEDKEAFAEEVSEREGESEDTTRTSWGPRRDKSAATKRRNRDAGGGESPQTEQTAEKDEYGLQDDDYALDNEGELIASSSAAAISGMMGRRPQNPQKGKRARKNDDGSEAEDAPAPLEEEETNGEYDTLYVLPLYALLDFQKQQEVFKTPPRGTRLCVVATNVAETSITIPNIRYVVDAGRAKSKVIDNDTKASCFRIEWVSQASAEQRSGRAGRMGPGHCYRLYSTAVYANVMNKHSTPEILRTPLDSVVLLMKHIGVENVGSFPFPSCPREEELKVALQHLAVIGALDPKLGYRITELGKELITYPVPPRFARAIAEVKAQNQPQQMLDLVLSVIAVASTSSNVFTGEGNQLKASKKDDCTDPVRRDKIRSLVNPGSDLITYMNAFTVYLQDARGSCHNYCLIQKSMSEARMLYRQLRLLARQPRPSPAVPLVGEQQPGGAGATAPPAAVEETDDVADTLDTNETWTMGAEQDYAKDRERKLTREDEMALRQMFIPGLLDQVARRATVQECRSLGVEYNDKRTSRTPYIITSTRSVAFVHPTSSVSRTFPPPEYLTFCFLQKIFRSDTREPQTTMLGITVVTKEWLNAYDFED